MATVEELREKFDSLPTAQKMQFALGIKAQIMDSGNEEHKQFYNECAEKYNAELRASVSTETPNETVLPEEQPIELPDETMLPDEQSFGVVALEKLDDKPNIVTKMKNIPLAAISPIKSGIAKIPSLFKKKDKKNKEQEIEQDSEKDLAAAVDAVTEQEQSQDSEAVTEKAETPAQDMTTEPEVS